MRFWIGVVIGCLMDGKMCCIFWLVWVVGVRCGVERWCLVVVDDQMGLVFVEVLYDGLGDVIGIQFVLCQQLCSVVMIDEVVWQVQVQYWFVDVGSG